MRLKKFLLTSFAISVTALSGISIATMSAQAKTFKLSGATPNLRGTWNRKYSDDHFAKTITVKTHSIRLKKHTYKMSVTAHGNDHYTLNVKGMQPISVYVRYKTLYGKDNRSVLNMYCGVGNSSPTDVYYKGKKVSTPKNYDLDYKSAPSSLKKCIGKTVYTDELVGSDLSVGLAKTEDDFENDNFAVKLTQTGIPMTLTKLFTDSDEIFHLGQVNYSGKSYVVDAGSQSGDVVPYNTEASDGVVTSSHKPTETQSILLKHGESINTSDLWEYVNPETGNEIDYSFSLSKDKWYVVDLS